MAYTEYIMEILSVGDIRFVQCVCGIIIYYINITVSIPETLNYQLNNNKPIERKSVICS